MNTPLQATAFIVQPGPHAFLTTKCDPFDFDVSPVDPDWFARSMALTRKHGFGIGLAAPQVRRTFRMFVMKTGQANWIAVFNPEIVEMGSMIDSIEGCLSFRGKICSVKRPEWLVAKYRNERRVERLDRFEGTEARCFHHEFDHLDGITMLDRMRKPTDAQLMADR